MTAHHDRRAIRFPTSGDYEREAEQTRRRLAEHLDELSNRLTPGQVLDEMLSYSRAGGGTFFRAFSNAMRENPLPSLLIGAGCMMFLSEKMGLRAGSRGDGGTPMMATADDPYGYGAGGPPSVGDAAGRMSDASPGRQTGSAASTARSAAASVQSRLGSAAEVASRQTMNAASAVADTMKRTAATVADTAAGAADAVRGTAHDLRDQASGAVDQARRSAQNAASAVRDTAASGSGALADTASSMGSALTDTASSVGGTIASTASRTRRQAADVVRQGRDNAAFFVTEQPLLCAAIGVAIGAALASLLPSTETEDKLMGEASDAVKATAGQVGSEALESAKNVASKVADRTKTALTEAAKEEGLSPGAIADAARNLGEGVRQGSEGAMNTMKHPMTGTGPQEGASGWNRS